MLKDSTKEVPFKSPHSHEVTVNHLQIAGTDAKKETVLGTQSQYLKELNITSHPLTPGPMLCQVPLPWHGG